MSCITSCLVLPGFLMDTLLKHLLNPFWNHWLSLQSDWLSAIYSRIALFFALNLIFFSANANGVVKQNNQSYFNDNARKWKRKKLLFGQFGNFCYRNFCCQARFPTKPVQIKRLQFSIKDHHLFLFITSSNKAKYIRQWWASILISSQLDVRDFHRAFLRSSSTARQPSLLLVALFYRRITQVGRSISTPKTSTWSQNHGRNEGLTTLSRTTKNELSNALFCSRYNFRPPGQI